MMAIRGTLLWNMPTDGRLKLKVFTSRDQGENQVSDSVQGVPNNGFLEPDDDPYTFYSTFYATRDIRMTGGPLHYEPPLTDDITFTPVLGSQRGQAYVHGSARCHFRAFEYDLIDSGTPKTHYARTGDNTR